MPTRTIPDSTAHQDRLLARSDRAGDAAAAVALRVWLDLLRVIRDATPFTPWSLVYDRARHVLSQLPTVAHTLITDLGRIHTDAAHWSAGHLAGALPAHTRRRLLVRHGLLEDVSTDARLLIGVLLPRLDPFAVHRVVYRSGWADTIRRLTALAAPDALAARVATGVQQGLTVQQIARLIRPEVEGVRAAAQRVARTAGLWVAHEAERDVYRGLEGDVIAGYTVRAVLDARTRPEHRARDGHQFWCRPTGDQRPLSECPHPPREADGSWAFNCRCWLDPILSV